jgi:hypothetical protein
MPRHFSVRREESDLVSGHGVFEHVSPPFPRISEAAQTLEPPPAQETAASPPARRSILQFRLRTLLAVVVVVSLALAGWVRFVTPQRARQRAAETLAESGTCTLRTRPGGPEWLRRRFGHEYWNVWFDVVEIKFIDPRIPQWHLPSRIGDGDLTRLPHFHRLEVLSLAGTEITDSGLVHLAGLAELQSLDLSGTRVTDAGMSHLTGLTRLTTLRLFDTAVSDEGIAALRRAIPCVRVFR